MSAKTIALTTVAALTILVTGCGEIEEQTAAEMVDGAQAADTVGLSGLALQGLAEDELRTSYHDVEAPPRFAFESQVADASADKVPAEPNIEVTMPDVDEGVEEEEFLNPLADGCASPRLWKDMATELCEANQGHLLALDVDGACGGGQMTDARIRCGVVDADTGESGHLDMNSSLLGGEGTCKSVRDFKNALWPICKTGTQLIEVSPVAACGENKAGDTLFSVMQVTCGKLDR
jgi:hypothetical protein